MIVDQRVADYAQLLCSATRNHPRVRQGLGPDHAKQIVDLASQAARDDGRGWVTPADIKKVFKTYPRGKLVCVDAGADVDAVIIDVLDHVAVP
jgi:MoxR-like ATPase